jgi:hypothetical protein
LGNLPQFKHAGEIDHARFGAGRDGGLLELDDFLPPSVTTSM